MAVESALIWRSLAVGSALLLANEVSAQPLQGSMDAQSRASIRISVSVMPRFSITQISSASAATPGDGIARADFPIFSNASGLRIHLVEGSKNADEAGLLLIAPD